MQCERARELLSPYLDGELSAEERRAVTAHIEGCRACSAQAADFGRIGRTLARTLETIACRRASATWSGAWRSGAWRSGACRSRSCCSRFWPLLRAA